MVCLHPSRGSFSVQCVVLYHLLSNCANTHSLYPEDLRLPAKSNQGQTGIPVSERPTLRPMPRKNIIEP